MSTIGTQNNLRVNGRAFEFVGTGQKRPMFTALTVSGQIHNMTLQQFRSMNDSNRLEALVNDSVFLAEHCTAHLSYRLYQMHGFYIEEIFSLNGNSSTMLQSRSFSGTNRLGRYLQQVNLEGLIF